MVQWGSRGPKEADELTKKYGYQRTTKYSWEPEEKREDKKQPSKL